MEKQALKKYVGKKVLLFLVNNLKYTGYITKIEASSITFLDKEHRQCLFDCSSVISLNLLHDDNIEKQKLPDLNKSKRKITERGDTKEDGR